MSAETFNPAEQLSEREHTIDTILAHARQSETVQLKEIPVWGADTVAVAPGETGIIATGELNGCHTSIIVGRQKTGERYLSMTHFPPSLGAERYKREITALKAMMEEQAIEPETIVTFSDKKRFPAETALLQEGLFNRVPVHDLTYDRRDPVREASPDKGQCLAILDNRAEQAVLYVATDAGDFQQALTGR